MKEFWELTKSRYHDFIAKAKRCVFPSHSWTPHQDEAVIEGSTESTKDTPYFHADEEPPTPIDYQSEATSDEEESQRLGERKE